MELVEIGAFFLISLVTLSALIPFVGYVANWVCKNYQGKEGYLKYFVVGYCVAFTILVLYGIFSPIGVIFAGGV